MTDLVGSTELRVRLGEERAEDFRRAHDRLLADTVTGHGGVVVKGLGDGVLASFAGAADAIAAAVAVQQRARASLARAAGGPVSLRVGLSAGDVTMEDEDCFGTPVVEASRLCAAAEGGEILAADVVLALARGRGGHSYEPAGALELKGLPEPVHAYRVLVPAAGRGAGADGVPLPPPLGVVPAAGVIGRTIERDALRTAWKAVVAGEGLRAVLLSGEPGAGKSTLAADLARAAHAEGATVLFGRAEDGAVVPYLPWAQALGHGVRHAADDVLDAHFAAHGGALARLVPGLGGRLSASPAATPWTGSAPDPEAERWLLIGAAVGLVAALAEAAPALLVLDDLQWADQPSLHVLRHLVSTSPHASVLVVGTYRSTDLAAGHPLVELLASLRREPSVERIDLAGFDDDELLTFVEAATGASSGDDALAVARALRREAGGNPFFTNELVRHLADTGALRQQAGGHWTLRQDIGTLDLPQSVREVLGQRVRRLGENAMRVLSAAAMLGPEIDLALLAELVEQDDEVVLAELEAAVAAGLLAEVPGRPGRFRFPHTLVPHTLAEDLSAARRARLHGRAADALERRPGVPAAEIAHHRLAATQPEDAERAARSALRAGDEALDDLAPDHAALWFRQALDHVAPEDRHLRARILVGLGTAQRQAGDPGHRATLLEAVARARELDDRELLARAALALNRGNNSVAGDVSEEILAALRAGLAAVGPDDSPARARLLATLALEQVWGDDAAERERLIDEAVGVARRLGDPATLAAAASAACYALWHPSNLDRLDALTGEALAGAERVADPGVRFWLLRMRMAVDAQQGDVAAAHRHWEQLDAIAKESNQPVLRWYATLLRAGLVLLTGDLDGADELARASIAQGEAAGQPDALVLAANVMVPITAERGDMGGFGPASDATNTQRSTSLSLAVPMWRCVAAGRLDEARERLEAILAGGLQVPRDLGWFLMEVILADVAATLDHEEAARLLIPRLAPWSGQAASNTLTVFPCVDHHLGRLATVTGDYDQAVRWLESAAALHERMDAPLLLGDTRVALARALLRRRAEGDVDRARRMVAEVVPETAARGWNALHRRAQQLTAEIR